MVVIVYRYGHRIERDKRITTHVALSARAFGADGIIIDRKDKKIEENIRRVVDRFGGNFFIESGVEWKKYFKEWEGKIIHLTMYGERIEDVIDEIRKNEDILIVVGAEKVPPEFYEIADYNVAVGNQPHSEVAALAIFLHFLNEGEWMKKDFNGVLKIVPAKKEKNVVYDYVKILEKEGCSEEVIKHSIKVRNLALEIAKKIEENGIKVDMEAVEAGSLLHDLGRAKTHGIMHVVEGAKIAKKYGLPKKITNIIKHHAGAGIDIEEAKKLGLPAENYNPLTIEEMIVSHADNLTGNKYRKIEETVNIFRKKIGKEAVKKLISMHEKLSEIAGIDINKIIEKMKG
ncbi:MAG TPA: tRNA (cytidine(56)-2'-O)-methyltransferase [Thermoplasmata archaeon]|nr:tRNA (cytidine(56)-2'-O)-methyltransferase [Thermoplasmata archaeon]